MDIGKQTNSSKLNQTDMQQAVHLLVNQAQHGQPESTGNQNNLLWKVAFFLCVIAAAGVGYWLRPASVVSEPVKVVKPSAVSRGEQANSVIGLKISGFFSAQDTVQISATVLARVKAIYVTEGMRVKKGDLLVELANARGDNDVQSARQRVDTAALQVSKTQLALQSSEEEQQRQTNLMKQGFSTRKAIDDSNLAVKQASLELAASRSAREDARANLQALQQMDLEYKIRAPFSGIVVVQNARVGEVVSPSNGGSFIRSGLLSLYNPETLQVEISVQERLLSQLNNAGCALVSSLAQPEQIKNVPFRLLRISNAADRQRGAVNAILVPKEPMQVLPILETSAEVQFVPAGHKQCSSTKN